MWVTGPRPLGRSQRSFYHKSSSLRRTEYSSGVQQRSRPTVTYDVRQQPRDQRFEPAAPCSARATDHIVCVRDGFRPATDLQRLAGTTLNSSVAGSGRLLGRYRDHVAGLRLSGARQLAHPRCANCGWCSGWSAHGDQVVE